MTWVSAMWIVAYVLASGVTCWSLVTVLGWPGFIVAAPIAILFGVPMAIWRGEVDADAEVRRLRSGYLRIENPVTLSAKFGRVVHLVHSAEGIEELPPVLSL